MKTINLTLKTLSYVGMFLFLWLLLTKSDNIFYWVLDLFLIYPFIIFGMYYEPKKSLWINLSLVIGGLIGIMLYITNL